MKSRRYGDVVHQTLMTALVLAMAIPEWSHAQSSCRPLTEDPVAFADAIEASGVDIDVTLSWSETLELPREALLVVRDAFCEAIAEVAVSPVSEITPPGPIVETVKDALKKASKHGLKYQVAVENDHGEALSEPLHFQVGLACSTEDSCRYELEGGIFSDGIFLSQDLDRALDEVAPHGDEDTLRTLIDKWPNLREEVYAFAAQLSFLDQQLRLPRHGELSCVWTTPVTSPRRKTLHELDEKRELKTVTGLATPGGPLYLAARTQAGQVDHEVKSEAAAGVKIRCQEISSWKTMKLRIESTSSNLKFRFPVFRSRETRIEGTVTHDIRFEVDMAARALGEDAGVLGETFQRTEVAIDGATIHDSTQEVAASSDAKALSSDFLLFAKALTTRRPSPSSASISLQSGISTWAEKPDLAFAEIANSYTVTVTGTANFGPMGGSMEAVVVLGNRPSSDGSGGVRIDTTPPVDTKPPG